MPENWGPIDPFSPTWYPQNRRVYEEDLKRRAYQKAVEAGRTNRSYEDWLATEWSRFSGDPNSLIYNPTAGLINPPPRQTDTLPDEIVRALAEAETRRAMLGRTRKSMFTVNPILQQSTR